MFDLERYLRDLAELVNIDSGSYCPEGLNKVGDIIAGRLQKLGWIVEKTELDPRTGRLVTARNREAERYAVTVFGHIDTVFPAGTAEKRPFTREGDMAFGPGTNDMKNGVLAMCCIAEELDESAPPVCLVFNPDEEIGSPYSQPHLRRIADRSDAVLIMESAQNGNTHCLNRKGMQSYNLELTGISAHAGYIFSTQNASAILCAAELIKSLYALTDAEKNTSVNVGFVRGGTADNVVADFAELHVETRMTLESERERIIAAVEALIASPPVKGVTVKKTFTRSTSPMNASAATLAYIPTLEKIAAGLGQGFITADRGGLSDGNKIVREDLILLDGMGPAGGHAHSEKEYLRTEAVEGCIRLVCEIIRERGSKA